MLQINVRLYGALATDALDGTSLAVDHEFDGIHDADDLGEGRLRLYLDLKHPAGHSEDNPGSSLDVTGTVSEIGAFIHALSMALADNVESNPNLPFEGAPA